MAQLGIKVVKIAREESRLLESKKERDYLRILHSLFAQFASDLTKGDAPPPQNLALLENDVLIQDVHSRPTTARSHVSPFRAKSCLPS